MAIIVLSVPHTGTRFLCTFLDSVGVIYRQYHSEPQNLLDLGYETKNKAVIPVRDPLLCLVSTLARSDLNNIENILDSVVMNYELLINLESQFDFEYLKVSSEDVYLEFQKIHEFAEAPLPMPESAPRPVGMIADTPTNYKTWEIFANQLGKDKAVEIEARLFDIRAHYGY